MRTIPAGLQAHLDGGVTTLCHAWRVTRRDGVVLGFTDHDEKLAFDGTDFLPAHGLDGGEASDKLGPQVDTGEVAGILHSDAITEDDIAMGRYDGATVETFRVNWRNVAERALLSRDTIGEITREDGRFRAEQRSAQQALNVAKGRLYQALCDAELGDARCGIDIDDPIYRAEASVAAVEDSFRLAVAGLESFDEGWFAFGKASWTDGKRVGLVDRITAHARIGGADILTFAEPVGEWVAAGDAFTAFAGCDRRFSTCKARFGNAVNFRGFPHIPGSDFILRYPGSDDVMQGRALVK
jgi:uncharacterized phage protein (TIGR02218 family)